MKFRLFIILLFLFGRADAQTRSSNSTLIKYQKAPAFVFKKVPRGSKSIFYGTWKTSQDKYPFHLHMLKLKNKRRSDETEHENIFQLDLYKNDSNSKRAPQLVCSTQFHIYYSPTRPVGIYQLWLDPKTKKFPIIELNLQFDDFYGGGYLTQFVIFPDGLSGKPAFQQFSNWGNLRERDWMEYDDNSSDENGNLFLTKFNQRYTDPMEEPKKTNLYWDKKQFAAKSAAQNH